MKNLKRTLCLALALVLAVGLLTVGAGAAFKDDAQINYKEAVELLTGLGVINGYPEDNSFRPTENFNRAGLAKMVAYFSWGGTDKSALYSGLNIFSDYGDSSTNWARGSINYGYNAGYISGYAQGDKMVYNPEGTVKGSELAKTLLVVLGYKADAKDPAYALLGSSWELNAIRLAQSEGLFANLSASFDPTAPLTREEAAQMFANLLTKTYTYTAYNDDKTPITAQNSLGVAPMVKYFTGWSKTENQTDDFGRPVTKYSKGSVTVNVGTNATLTYTAPVTEAKVFADLGLTSALTPANVTKSVNGAVAAPQTLTYNGGAISDSGNGVLTEVYYNAVAGTVKFVFIDTYFGTVKSVKPATAITKEYVTVDTAAGEKTFDISGLAVNDSVIYTYSASTNKIESLSKVSSTTVTPNSYSGTTSFTAGGKTYQYSDNIDPAQKISAFDSVSIYLDNYGYVIATTSVESVPNYAVFLSSTNVTNWPNPASINAQILKADGTVAIVENVSSVQNLAAGDIVTYANGTGSDSGKIVLTKVGPYAADSAVITKGTVAFTLNSSTKKADAKTIFLVKTVDTNNVVSYAAYVGISNVPSIASSSGSAYYDKAADGYADIVYVDTAVLKSAPIVADTIAYIDASSAVQHNDLVKGKYTVYNAVVDGTITKVETTENLITADGIYGKLAKNDKGLVSAVTDLAGAEIHLEVTPVTGTESAKNGIVTLGTTELTYTDATQVYMVSDTGITASSVSAIGSDRNDTVVYYTTNGVLTAAYITVVA